MMVKNHTGGLEWIRSDSVTSTNSTIQELLKRGEISQELVVVADYQEQGKGQGDHSWHSEHGQNLLLSLLLFPEDLSAAKMFRLSMLVSLSICDLLEREEIDPVIKWPNDILTVNGKISGILIENGISGNRVTHSVIGIGINLNQTAFPEFPLRATSLRLETGNTTDTWKMAQDLVELIMTRYRHLHEKQGERLAEEYLEKLFLRNRTAVFTDGGRTFRGRILGVNGEGELLVARGSRIRAYGTHEISLGTPLLPKS